MPETKPEQCAGQTPYLLYCRSSPVWNLGPEAGRDLQIPSRNKAAPQGSKARLRS